MYGMVNKAVEEMVVLHHGEAVWEEIKAKAGVDVDVFMSNESYSDDVTYNLVGAASAVLGVPADQILVGDRRGVGCGAVHGQSLVRSE